jgi:hypothetical protein
LTEIFLSKETPQSMSSVSPLREREEVARPAAILGLVVGLVNGVLDLVPILVLVAVFLIGLAALFFLSNQGSEAGPFGRG